MEEILRDILIRGIADPEIQSKILGAHNQELPFKDVLKLIEAKEAGKRTATSLTDSQGAQALRSSSYKKTGRQPQPDTRQKDPCGYCGEHGHGHAAPTKIRRVKCPAFGHKCQHCQKEHHFPSVCRSRSKTEARSSPAGDKQEASAASLCSITSIDSSQTSPSECDAIALDHHVYDQLSDTWINRKSQEQPYLKLTVALVPEDISTLGFSCSVPAYSTQMDVMADTGCQSCLAGLGTITRLGLRQSDLIPVTMKMHAANNNGIKILGATVLRFSGQTMSGQINETRILTYVTDSSNKLIIH